MTEEKSKRIADLLEQLGKELLKIDNSLRKAGAVIK